MKKNFFKKLSFVMALAMIISVIAPAAGAFAATGLRLNATTKTLFLGENNTYNFNALGKSKGATEKWTSSKTSVATVNAKNGVVTAKAVGTTTITATITNAKKTVTKKLTAKVTVGDNVKTLSVAAPAGTDTAKLVVGTDYALATSYVTKSGSKSKTSNTFAWSVDKEGATVSKTGVFKATTPGEYTVTVTANRYKNVKVADATIKVTVLNAIKAVKQTTTNAFTVEFAGKVEKDALKTNTASVAQIINGKDVTTGSEKIKSIALDSTGTIATVELYADFVAKTTYKFVYGDLTGTFTAASKDVKDVTGIVFDDFTVNIAGTGTDLSGKVFGVNADGVKILTGADLSPYLTFSMDTAEQTKGYVDTTKKAYIYAAGNVINVKATFTNYVLDDTTKTYKQVTFSDSAVGTGVTEDVNTSTLQYAVATSEPASISSAWTSEISLAVADPSLNIYTRYKKTTDPNGEYKVDSTGTTFKYSASDSSKISIFGNTIFAVGAGTATVIVKDKDDKVVGSFDVKINPARTLVALTPDENTNVNVSVGNNPTVGETKDIVFKVLDNTGAGLKSDKFNTPTYDVVSKPSDATATPNVAVSKEDGKAIFTIDAKNASIKKGLYQYKITVTSGNVTREAQFGVTVGDATSVDAKKVTTFSAVLESAPGVAKEKYDFADQKVSTDVDYTVAVYGINAAGFRVEKLDASAYTSEVRFEGNVVTSGSSLKVVSTTNGALKLEKKGVYTLTAKSASQTLTGRVVGSFLASSTLTTNSSYILNANVVPAVTKSSLDSATVQSLLAKGLELTITKSDVKKVDFSKLTDSDVVIKGINRSSGVKTISLSESVDTGSFWIESVTVYIDVDEAGVNDVRKEFTFNIEKPIDIK